MTDTLDRPFDFVDPDMMQRGLPLAEFAELRRPRRSGGTRRSRAGGGFTDGGYWVISHHEHIKAISKNNDMLVDQRQRRDHALRRRHDRRAIDITKALLINHDPPEHTRLRKIVSELFTPRAVHELEEKLRGAAHAIVDRRAGRRAPATSSTRSRRLPLLAIADLLGVPAGRPGEASSTGRTR